MMAAITAANQGADVIIWERNETLGRKLAITGKGRCNITNDGDIDDFMANIPGNGRFLYSALCRFGAPELKQFCESLGLPLIIERGRRVFPMSQKAADVVEAFKKELSRLKVKIIYGVRAESLSITKSLGKRQVVGANSTGDACHTKAVIITTGGMSYPSTGSTGDGYRLARAAGHTITLPRPSLTPLVASDDWVEELAGLSLRNIQASLYDGNTLLGQLFGELLFTHFGLSGPVILSLSRVAGAYFQENEQSTLRLLINFKPALSPEQLDQRLLRDWEDAPRRAFGNSLDRLLPKSLIPVVVRLSGIDYYLPAGQINKKARGQLVNLLQAFPCTITGCRPFSEAIITAGGVSTAEINPRTMSSRLTDGLYFAGEVIDVDALTGGYNLQIAFSTGHAAGEAAASYALNTKGE